MKKYITYIISLVFLCTVFGNMKIGYIDSNQIMSELEEVREVQIEIDKEQKRLEAELTNMIGTRDSLIQSYQMQKILIVDDNKRMEKEKEIEDLARRIELFQMEKFGPNTGEIYKISNQLFAPVLSKIDAAINKVGNDQGYDYIIDAVSGALVFAQPEHNLTFAVIEELRKATIENQEN